MNQINAALEILNEECNELRIGSIVELESAPNALEFARDFYAKQTPLVIRNAIKHWPAVQKWTPDYFHNLLGEKIVDVAVTPTGYADAIVNHQTELNCEADLFAMPHEEQMRMSEFLQRLDGDDDVYYIQKQNSNFTLDFPELAHDIDTSVLNFAQQSFNKEPDAVNFWMGDLRAVTSMHKDPYDNLYCVISGHKDFILLPPHQLAYIPRRKYRSAKYVRNECGQLTLQPLASTDLIEWVVIDPLLPNIKLYPEYSKAQPLNVRVNAGDMLYLPSFWFHHVRQSHKCIAVNFWYDMEFDSRYCYFRMLEKLTENM